MDILNQIREFAKSKRSPYIQVLIMQQEDVDLVADVVEGPRENALRWLKEQPNVAQVTVRLFRCSAGEPKDSIGVKLFSV
jgi:hypothetical protein